MRTRAVRWPSERRWLEVFTVQHGYGWTLRGWRRMVVSMVLILTDGFTVTLYRLPRGEWRLNTSGPVFAQRWQAIEHLRLADTRYRLGEIWSL